MIHPDKWIPTDGIILEPNALEAVREVDANVVVAAGPGAGKTELLAQKVDFLLRTEECRFPRRILAISFKVDAARNLQTRVRNRSGAQYSSRFDSFTFHAFAKRLIDNFRPALTGQNSLDPDYTIDTIDRIQNKQIRFDDLVPLSLEILENNNYARGALRQTYSHVFMDEFQDATVAQYSFLKEAFYGTNVKLIGVGDTKQRIMGFADALDGVMQTFAEDFDARSFQLYQNFRSKPRLRRMQNRMILEMDPPAAVPQEELQGEEGEVRVFRFQNDKDEAATIAGIVESWLNAGIPPWEITVLVRQQPHLICGVLLRHFQRRGVPYRNEQQSQDLFAEPAAALIFNFLRVVADDSQPDAYTELVRVVTRGGVEEADDVFHSKLKEILTTSRVSARAADFDPADYEAWKALIYNFLRFVTRPSVSALSAAYQQGTRLDDLISDSLKQFRRELEVDGDPKAALDRLSEEDAVRILTVHKCKGLEFENVIVLGVEEQFFWGDDADNKAEFFVAISRAKHKLFLTHSDFRAKPRGANWRWREESDPSLELLRFADED